MNFYCSLCGLNVKVDLRDDVHNFWIFIQITIASEGARPQTKHVECKRRKEKYKETGNNIKVNFIDLLNEKNLIVVNYCIIIFFENIFF